MKPALLRRKVKLKTLILAAILLCLTPSLSRTETTAAFQQGVEYVKLRLYPQKDRPLTPVKPLGKLSTTWTILKSQK